MKDIDIIRYEIINYLSEEGLDFQIHIFKENFRIEFIPSTTIICDKADLIIFKFSTQNPNEVLIEFEEQFNNVKDLLVFLKHYKISKSNPFFFREFLITNFLKYNLGIDDYFVRRGENSFSGKKYIDISFDKVDNIHVSIEHDKYVIKNWGIASEIEWGFFDVEPILVSADLDDVLVFLKDNFGGETSSK